MDTRRVLFLVAHDGMRTHGICVEVRL
jgi:hypothetical protein